MQFSHQKIRRLNNVKRRDIENAQSIGKRSRKKGNKDIIKGFVPFNSLIQHFPNRSSDLPANSACPADGGKDELIEFVS